MSEGGEGVAPIENEGALISSATGQNPSGLVESESTSLSSPSSPELTMSQQINEEKKPLLIKFLQKIWALVMLFLGRQRN